MRFLVRIDEKCLPLTLIFINTFLQVHGGVPKKKVMRKKRNHVIRDPTIDRLRSQSHFENEILKKFLFSDKKKRNFYN